MAGEMTCGDVDLLPYDIPYLTPELKKKAKQELFEDDDGKYHSLKLLRTMLKDEPNLNFRDDEEFLLGFLRAKKYDVKRACNLVKTFYAIKQKHDELYENYENDNIVSTLSQNCIGLLPYRDSDGCVLFILRVANWNPHKHNMGDVMRALTVLMLYAIRSPSTQIAGFKCILDFKGFTLGQLPHVSPKYLWLVAEALQNCFPARFKGVHVVNEGYLFTYVWNIVKQFLSQKLTDRFHFHGKHVSKLHKYFSPSVLPMELEGKLPSFDNASFIKIFLENLDYYSMMNSYGYIKPRRKRSAS